MVMGLLKYRRLLVGTKHERVSFDWLERLLSLLVKWSVCSRDVVDAGRRGRRKVLKKELGVLGLC